jgi:hypothetical protein
LLAASIIANNPPLKRREELSPPPTEVKYDNYLSLDQSFKRNNKFSAQISYGRTSSSRKQFIRFIEGGFNIFVNFFK